MLRNGEILWDLLRFGQILWDFVWYCEIWWDTCMVRFSYIHVYEIWWDSVRFVQINLIRLCGIWRDLVRFSEIWWDSVRYGEILSDSVRFCRVGAILWNSLKYMYMYDETSPDSVRFDEINEIWLELWWELVDLVRYSEIQFNLVRYGEI